ncbi:hypothetical protein I4U23_011902 [Adineta vaga]|nr:hypothetical protein I4U23_011902 [Adineta vaga]
MIASRILKKFIFFVVIAAVAVPLRYGSTNPKYVLLRLIHSALTLKNCFVADQNRPTLSPAYRAFEEILKSTKEPPHDPLADTLTTIQQQRASFPFVDIIPKPGQCQITKEIFIHGGHNVDAYWVDHRQKHSQKRSDKIILYFHGGSYTLGDIHSYSGSECHYSKLFNMTILHLEYRLIPEHPVPSAVEDAVAIYRALLAQGIEPSQIFIMGDSAGGGLALLTIQYLITHQLSVPHGVVVLAPWTDLSLSGESYTRNRHTDAMFNSDRTKWEVKVVVDTYASKLPPNDPIFSPLFGSFKGFPPMYVNVGTADTLEDDARGVVKKAQEAGVSVTFEAGLHLMHVYPAFFDYFPEARQTLDNINKWIHSI